MGVRDHFIVWSGLTIAPLLTAQALWARHRAPLLPAASPPDSGRVASNDDSSSELLSIVIAGESTAAGVGASNHERALAGQLATSLAHELSRPVAYSSLGLIGARAADCLAQVIELELLPSLSAATVDLIVLALGANDTAKLTSRATWRRVLETILLRLRVAFDGPILFTGVPPMHAFTALPQPLRAVVGARARLLDDDVACVVARHRDCYHHRPTLVMRPDFLAPDGYHPSELGYARWAEQLANLLVPVLNGPPSGRADVV